MSIKTFSLNSDLTHMLEFDVF